MFDIKLLPPSTAFSSNTYMLSSGGESAIIDPSSAFDENITQNNLKYIILTHGHYDHMINIDEWVKNTNAIVFVSAADKDKLSDPALNCATLFKIYSGGYSGEVKPLCGGETLLLGSEIIKVIETPGHTEGSISLLAGTSLFVGDTIFAGGGYGKCCFPGGDFAKIRKSIIKLMSLDENLTVYAGHGNPTTIKEYKKDFLR